MKNWSLISSNASFAQISPNAPIVAQRKDNLLNDLSVRAKIPPQPQKASKHCFLATNRHSLTVAFQKDNHDSQIKRFSSLELYLFPFKRQKGIIGSKEDDNIQPFSYSRFFRKTLIGSQIKRLFPAQSSTSFTLKNKKQLSAVRRMTIILQPTLLKALNIVSLIKGKYADHVKCTLS